MRIPGIPQSSGNLGTEAGGQMCQGGEGREGILLSRTQRPVQPGHTEPMAVLLKGLKAGPTDVSPGGAPCSPLQGTVQAPRTGGLIWGGSRGRLRQRPFTEAALSQAPLPHPTELARPGSGHCSGQALPPNQGIRTRKTNSPKTYRNFPAPPTPQSPLSSLSQPSVRELTLTVRAAPSAPGQGCAALHIVSALRVPQNKPLSRLGPGVRGLRSLSGSGAATHLSLYIRSALRNLVLPTHSPREQSQKPGRINARPGRQSLPHAQPLACHREAAGVGTLGWHQPV